MKNLKCFMLCLLILCLMSCREKTIDRESLSPVREANQSTQNFINSVNSWAGQRDLSQMDHAEFISFIYNTNPNLDRDVIRDLTNYKKIEPGEKISLRYHYFDKEGTCRMEDGKGNFSKVKFKNEIVVEVIRIKKESFWVAISCLNGMLDISSSPGVSSNALISFTIEKGRGLSHYLADDYWSINVAEEFNLPLFRGKKQASKNLITPIQARELIPEVEKVQITVFVEEGWKFVLSGDNWTLNGLTPEEFRRQK